MTLIDDKVGTVLSLNPLGYSLKDLKYEANFEDISDKVKNQTISQL